MRHRKLYTCKQLCGLLSVEYMYDDQRVNDFYRSW